MFIPAYRDSLRSSVLRHSADAYVGYLKHHQYCPATIRAYLYSIEHFARWVRHIPLSSIDESLTHRFVIEHLSVCRFVRIAAMRSLSACGQGTSG
jgi:hypothetical protein